MWKWDVVINLSGDQSAAAQNPSELCLTFWFQHGDGDKKTLKTDTLTCRIILISSDVSLEELYLACCMLHVADADAVVQGLICNLLITLVIENNNYNVLW